MKIPVISICLVSFLLTSCAPAPKALDLQRIPIGTNKDEVVKALGKPRMILGNTRNCYGQMIETWEYRLKTHIKIPPNQSAKRVAGAIWSRNPATIVSLFGDPEINYWLHFFQDELVYWSRANDWEKEADRIYWMRFEINNNSRPILRQSSAVKNISIH
jgi:hypothetical protein